MDTSLIGHKATPKKILVEHGQLQLFVKATGIQDPIYRDLDAAKAAGHPGLPVPPTYMMCLDTLAPSTDPDILLRLGVDIGRILHGEQRFKYKQPIYAGDEITFQSEITDMYEKKGGALQFVITEITATNQHEQVVGSMTSSLVIR